MTTDMIDMEDEPTPKSSEDIAKEQAATQPLIDSGDEGIEGDSER